MCDFPGRLVAWLDDELPEGEAAEVQRHVESCMECRSGVDGYERVSKAVNGYCDEAVAAKVHRGAVRWTLMLSAAAVVGIALLTAFPRERVERTLTEPPIGVAVGAQDAPTVTYPAKAFEAAPDPQKKIHRPRAAAAPQSQDTNWMATVPAIQIAIPADAMFPPGAVPDGINFVAELSIAPDGSAQGLRLQPRLVGLERRATQP